MRSMGVNCRLLRERQRAEASGDRWRLQTTKPGSFKRSTRKSPDHICRYSIGNGFRGLVSLHPFISLSQPYQLHQPLPVSTGIIQFFPASPSLVQPSQASPSLIHTIPSLVLPFPAPSSLSPASPSLTQPLLASPFCVIMTS